MSVIKVVIIINCNIITVSGFRNACLLFWLNPSSSFF